MTDELKPVAWKVHAPDSHYCELLHTSLGEPLGGLLIENGWTETPLYTDAQLEALQQRVRELEEAAHMAMLELGSHGACPACCNAHSTLRNAITKPETLK